MEKTLDELLSLARNAWPVDFKFFPNMCEKFMKQDVHKTIELYKLAAKEGNDSAQNNLGYCYENGEGVQKDITKVLFTGHLKRNVFIRYATKRSNKDRRVIVH